MRERNQGIRESVVNHISSRTGMPVNDVLSHFEECFKKGLGKAEIFRQLITGYGNPKAHISGEVEFDLKRGTRFHNQKVSTRRLHRDKIK